VFDGVTKYNDGVWVGGSARLPRRVSSCSLSKRNVRQGWWRLHPDPAKHGLPIAGRRHPSHDHHTKHLCLGWIGSRRGHTAQASDRTGRDRDSSVISASRRAAGRHVV